MSYPNHNNHGRSSRPSPPGVGSHSGSSYAEQGRTTLPPLTVTFPTSFDPPGLSLNFSSTHLNSTFMFSTQRPTITKTHTFDLMVVRRIRTKRLIMDSKVLGSVLNIGTFSLPGHPGPSINAFLFQALPAPDDGELEGHWDNVPQPAKGIAERGIPQGPRLNSPHHVMAGYQPLMLGVSNFSLPGIRPSLTNDTWSTGPCGRSGSERIPLSRVCPRHPPTRTSQCSGEPRFRCPIWMLNQTLRCRRGNMTFLTILLSMLHQALLRLHSILRLFIGPPLPTN